MAYETLNNNFTIISLPSNKPQYKPRKLFKNALKSLCHVFKKSNRHQIFLNETICSFDFDVNATTCEVLENQENEFREASNK